MLKQIMLALVATFSISSLYGYTVINQSSKTKVLTIQEVHDPCSKKGEEKYENLVPLNDNPKKLEVAPGCWEQVEIESCRHLHVTITEEDLRYDAEGEIIGGTITKSTIPISSAKEDKDMRDFALVFKDEEIDSPSDIFNDKQGYKIITWPPELLEIFLEQNE
ncbi:hypothetical protein K0U07_01325 [bacterium]|nr:hypothetical protein [bacterium]